MKKIILFLLCCFVSQNVLSAIFPPSALLSEACPKDNPFFVHYEESTNSNYCTGCDTKIRLIIAKGHEKDFDICQNRVTLNGTSYLKTGNGLEVWDGDFLEDTWKWNPCTSVTSYPEEGIYYMNSLYTSEENCALCSPYRKYDKSGECVVIKSPVSNRSRIVKKTTSLNRNFRPLGFHYELLPGPNDRLSKQMGEVDKFLCYSILLCILILGILCLLRFWIFKRLKSRK